MPENPREHIRTSEGTERTGISRPELAKLSHELRGALTVISGYSELLRLPLEPSDLEAAIEGIGRAVRRADALIEQALSETVAPSHSMARLELATLAQEVVAEQRAATGRDIRLEVLGEPVVIADPDSLARALANLIDNAAKYSMAASAVDVQVDETAGSAMLRVMDRGPGIAEEDRERAFLPFERLESAPEVHGSGIGLAIVREVAEAHGGSVGIEDREGGGAVILIELPVARQR